MEVFWMSPTLGVEAIMGLVSIHLHLRKLFGRFLLWQSFLPLNHIIHSILSSNGLQEHKCHFASIDHLMAKQRMKLKLPLIDADDKRNKFFPSFFFYWWVQTWKVYHWYFFRPLFFSSLHFKYQKAYEKLGRNHYQGLAWSLLIYCCSKC